jgi:predicted unusual protein kinase regulating ubiquinone biosynthesis (AarF/ABC1/UbiB family)
MNVLLCLFRNQNEVDRAIELREIVTSLGPAYIKLGQALSIRPDILSPVAMTELQKLCDKVCLLHLLPFLAVFPVYAIISICYES